MKIKLDLDAWSEAELDLIGAKEIACCLSERLFNCDDKQGEQIAYAIARLIESALMHIETGRVND